MSSENILPFPTQQAHVADDHSAGLSFRIDRRGDFVVEIIEDRSLHIFHCIIRRSNEIAFWGQYTTRREAEGTAKMCLGFLTRSEEAA